MNVVWNTIQSCYIHGQYKAKRGVVSYLYMYYEPLKSNQTATSSAHRQKFTRISFHMVFFIWISREIIFMYVINTWDTGDNNISCEIYMNIFTWIFLLMYASREKFHGNFTCGDFAYDMNVLKVRVKIDIIEGLPC